MSTTVQDIRVFITRIHERKAGGKHHLTEDVAQETEGTVEVSENHSKVRVGAEQVFNLGNYESLRVIVQIEVPCEKDEVASTLKELTQKLPGRVQRVKNEFLKDQE